ncbi:MAG: META domain-containing protein [Prevotellaceae bacterium]|nr:META domain-containing protein [Prevotellaceae bacterium]
MQTNLNSVENQQSNLNSDKQQQSEKSNPQKDLSFQNTKWLLKTIDGQQIESPPKPAYITFGDDDTFSGFSGCNGFSGSYYLSGDILKLDNVISTQRGCLGGNNPERLFFSVISRTDACTVIGNKLILTQMSAEIATFEGVNE